ncbi:MAG: hypothetical protein H8D78_00570, partial [Chloroflexi bacterium]|nr:hypothetical protein [Chloroflexota bacterium]
RAGAAALPMATAVFTWVERNRTATPRYFSATSQVLVEHASPQAGSHTFIYLAGSEALTSRVSALLAPLRAGAADGDAAVLLPAEAFSTFVGLAVAGDARAGEVLTATGCPLDMSAQLADDFGEGAVLFGMAAWGLRDSRPAGGRTLVAALAGNRCWLVEDASDDRSRLCIRHVSGAECQTAFLSLLEPLFAARAAG